MLAGGAAPVILSFRKCAVRAGGSWPSCVPVAVTVVVPVFDMLGLSMYTNATMDGVQFIVAGHHFKITDSDVVRKEPKYQMYAVNHY